MEEIKNFTIHELEKKLVNLKFKKFKAKQIFKWIYDKGILDFGLMTNISKEERSILNKYFQCHSPEIVSVQKSKDGTIKFTLSLSDQNIVESVIIPDEKRNTLCISTQAGCRMGCKFCFTGKTGFKRNLLVSEIVDQIVAARFFLESKMKISNLVFMGMGEPLDNLENVLKSLHIIINEDGLNFSNRRITVSTCGIADRMLEFGAKSDVNLAVSLHSAINEKRDVLMPVNKKFPVETLMKACKNYPLKKRQRITFEYIMIKDFNDSIKDAKAVVYFLGDLKSKVNLITFNTFPEAGFSPSPEEKVRKFQEYIISKGITTTVRKSKGSDILAACGQLAGEKRCG